MFHCTSLVWSSKCIQTDGFGLLNGLFISPYPFGHSGPSSSSHGILMNLLSHRLKKSHWLIFKESVWRGTSPGNFDNNLLYLCSSTFHTKGFSSALYYASTVWHRNTGPMIYTWWPSFVVVRWLWGDVPGPCRELHKCPPGVPRGRSTTDLVKGRMCVFCQREGVHWDNRHGLILYCHVDLDIGRLQVRILHLLEEWGAFQFKAHFAPGTLTNSQNLNYCTFWIKVSAKCCYMYLQ